MISSLLFALCVSQTSQEASTQATAEPQFHQYATWNNRSLIFNKPIERDWFHGQILFGIGGGPQNEGIFHAMELGGTFKNGMTLALLHTFVQNKGVIGPERGPDLIGGWMLEFKMPIFAPEFEVKVAAGLGGLHDQSGPTLKAVAGFGWAYGIDFHLPVFTSSGPTIGLTFIHSLVPYPGALVHYFTAGVGAGYTFF